MIPEQYRDYETTCTIAAVNFSPVWGDKAATLDKIEATVIEAARQGADLIAFPEEALTTPTGCAGCRDVDGPCDWHHGLAETVPGPAADRIARVAKEHDCYVFFGLAERDRHDPAKLYNAVAAVGPEGVLGTYRKVHLGSLPWVTEGITFTPGNELPVFETRFGPVGVQICYDYWFNPELTRLLALKGARVVLNCCASFTQPGKREYMEHTTRTRAQENLIYTASANHVGGPGSDDTFGADDLHRERAANFAGHSVIAGPAFPRFSQTLAQAGDQEEIVCATVSFERLHRWESIFPWRDWRRGHQTAVNELLAKEFQAFA